MSYHNIPSSARQSTTNAQGQTAPPGYHYMPDGSLMSDVEHARLYTEIKTIRSFVLNTDNIAEGGETRQFAINGDKGFVFSLEVKREDNYYYNFTTNLFQATKTRLDNEIVNRKTFTGNISFPIAPTTTDTVNGAVTSGVKVIMDTVVASTMEVGDKITGNAYLNANNVTVAALDPDGDNTSEFSLSEAVAISDGVTLSFVGSDQYDFLLFAEQGTKHNVYKEVRLEDGSIDINSTTGSNSLLIKKVIYQTLDVTLILSTISPNGVAGFAGHTATTRSIVVPTNKSGGKRAFSIPISAGSTHSFKINRLPTTEDVGIYVTRTIASAPADIPGEDIYPAISDTDTVNGVVADDSTRVVMDNNVADNVVVGDRITTAVTTDTVDGAVSSGVKIVMDSNVATKMAVGDQVTSDRKGTFLGSAIVTVVALNPDGDNAKEFSINAVLGGGREFVDEETLTFSSKCNREITTVVALDPDGDNTKEFSMTPTCGFRDNVTLSFSNRMNYSWPLDNTDGLSSGMVPIASNLTSGSRVSSYEETLTVMEGTVDEEKIVIKKVEAIEKLSSKPTISRNTTTKLLTTTQTGNITFNQQQKLVLASDVLKFYSYGSSAIKIASGWDIELSDIKITFTKPTALTTAAVISSTTVYVDDGDGIMDDVSTVSGIGIDPGVVDPTVTTIGSYSGTTATLTLSAAQTLEDGTTLTFDGAGRVITITGNIEIKKSEQIRSDWNGYLYFDLEKFITATDES